MCYDFIFYCAGTCAAGSELRSYVKYLSMKFAIREFIKTWGRFWRELYRIVGDIWRDILRICPDDLAGEIIDERKREDEK